MDEYHNFATFWIILPKVENEHGQNNMTNMLRMILRQLTKVGIDHVQAGGKPLTAEQKAAQKRVRKAIKATQRMNRI